MFLKNWTLSCFFLLSRHFSSKVLEWTLMECHEFLGRVLPLGSVTLCSLSCGDGRYPMQVDGGNC